MKKIISCLYQAAVRTIDHDGVEHAGYMSFMILLSIFPFLIFFLALTSFVGASELGQNFIDFLLVNMPENTTDIIKSRLNELSKIPPQSLLTLAIVGSIWTASSFVECLRTILNRVHEITSPPTYIRRRLLSIVQFLIISLLITFTMFLLVIIPIGLAKIPSILEIVKGYESVLNLFRYSFILIALFISISTLYYIIPNVSINFVDVLPGSVLTVFLWVVSGHLLSSNIIYYNQLSVVYGSLGSIIVTLIFFYIINMLFIYGAEFNYLLMKNRAIA
ncbi:YihY/virulence factor BrkB family protein [Candidatus Trichorickettsia mobilis]|uniref:YihY/virulence factor BrkB family protein n=1 Tax=Candidatus Trichorickettsia mobilis TaxID=1346319 RepID=UPI0029310C5F|nr:YihY/virulence factor BrkB family protein [Candidatus Trichorickettsia mobilis]